MTSQKTPFLVAVVLAIFSLIWAQIAAPTPLKPLTNHLLDYPHAVPSLAFDRGIYRANVSHIHPVATTPTVVKNWLNSYLPKPLEIMCTTNDERGFCGGVNERQAKYGGYAGGGTGEFSNAVIGSDAEKAGQLAAIIASNKGASIDVIKNAIKAAGLDVPAVIPTKAATASPTGTAPTQSAAYIAQYGTEVGRYGYVYADGSVAGTTKLADGSIRVLALGDTQSAAARNSQVVASQVSSMSDEELLKSTGTTCTTNCQDKVAAAVTTILENSAVLDTQVKAEIIATQQQNSLSQAEYQAKIQAFLSPTTDLKSLAGCDPSHPGECRDLTAESYLRGLGADTVTVHELLTSRDTNIANYKRDLELVAKYADPSISDLKLVAEACGGDFQCASRMNRDTYLANNLTNKDLASQAKQQLAQNQMVAKYLTTPSQTLSNEYCRGVSSDRCKYLLEGGLLKDLGISSAKALELNRQKQANFVIDQYKLGQTGNIAGQPIDYEAIKRTEYLACMTNTQGKDDCEAYAIKEANKKLIKAAPVNYQTEYETALKTCQLNAEDESGCPAFATAKAERAVGTSTKGATYVPKLEALYLASACTALGGTNCENTEAALTSLSTYTNNPEITLINIQSEKNRIYQNNMSRERVAHTLQSIDPANYERLAADPSTDWVAEEKALTELRQDFGTNVVLSWNNFTAGRFKRGNDMLMSQYEDCTGITLWSCNKIDDYSRLTMLQGGIIQGGDAAAVVTAGVAAALPAAGAVGLTSIAASQVGLTGFLGTGFGVATSTQMTASATDTCTQAPGSEACYSAIAIAGISVVGTGLGVLQGAAQAANVGGLTGRVGSAINASTAIQRSIQYTTLASEAVGSIAFTAMAYETYNDPNVSSLDKASSIMMAVASLGKLGSSAFGISKQLYSITNGVKAAEQATLTTGATGLQLTHSISSGLFLASACSKIFEGPANIDETAMCAMGISGAVQDPLIAKLTAPKTAAPAVETAATGERIATTTELASLKQAEAKAKVAEWQKVVEGTSGTEVKAQARERLAEAQAALDALTPKTTVTQQQSQAEPIGPVKSKTIIERVSEKLFGKKITPVEIASKEIILNEKYKEVVETLGSAEAKTGTKVFDKNGGSILVAETTRTASGKEVTTFKFNEKISERAGLNENHLSVLNEVLSEYQGQFEKQLGFDPALGQRAQQAEYIISGLEAFGKNGTSGSLFAALPGLGKTEVIIPMMNYLHASMTKDAQFILFPEAKLMRPWGSIGADGKFVKNQEIITFFENKFGEGSVLILESGQVPNESAVKKARIVVSTRDAAFELQNIETLGGKALRQKWGESYKFVDESHWTTNLFENFRRSNSVEKIAKISEAKVFKDALETVRKYSSVNEVVEARKKGSALEVGQTTDGKSGEFTPAREAKIINEFIKENRTHLPEELRNRTVDTKNLKESHKLLDEFIDQNFSTNPEAKRMAAELTMINKSADLLAGVPGGHYGLTKTNGANSIAPLDQSRATGRTYSSLAEQIIYNTLGVEILKGVGEMSKSININVDKLTVSRGGSETTYARLMLEGKGFAMFTGTPELMAKLYKIAYGIELKVFSASAYETTSTRFLANDQNGIFTSIKEQISARVNEKLNQVYVNMDAKTNNASTRDYLASNHREGKAMFIETAGGERLGGVIEKGKFVEKTKYSSFEEMQKAQDAAGEYVKFYEYGAHTGVDSPNNVEISRAVGICNGCDQTTFSQGINRVRLDAAGKASLMDIIFIDAPTGVKTREGLFTEFTNSTGANEKINMTIAEVNFKEILLKTSVDITFERILAQTRDGFVGNLLDRGLRGKVEAIQGEWKNINEYGYKLENANLTPEQKLTKTLEQVKGIMESLDRAIGKNAGARAEFNSSAGNYKDLGIAFKDTTTVKQLGSKPSLSDVVDLINNTSAELKSTTVTFKERGTSGETILASAQEAVARTAESPTLLSRVTTGLKNLITRPTTPSTLTSQSLTPATRRELTNSLTQLGAGLAAMSRPFANTPTRAQQSLTQAEQHLANIQQLEANTGVNVTEEELADAKARVQQAEFLVKNGYPIPIHILDNESIIDILSTTNSELEFTSKSGIHKFSNNNGQITYSENDSLPVDVTLREALALLPKPGEALDIIRGTNKIELSSYRLIPTPASPTSPLSAATAIGTKLAGQITNTLDTASLLTPQSTDEVVTPKTSINNLVSLPKKANKMYARARSTIIKKISRVINSRRSYPYFDPLKMKKTISPEGQIFIEKYVNPNIPDHTISETATYLLENLANLAPINPSVYWELFYQLSFSDKKAVANRFVSRDLLKNMDLINFINNPRNKEHFYQLLDYVWDYADETRLSDNIINNTQYAIRSSELHNYFIGMNNYYESTKFDFDQIRIIALQNSLNTTIPLIPPPFLTGDRLQLYQEQVKIIEEIHQLVLTNDPTTIQKIKEYLDQIDPNVTKQIEQIINLLAKNEFNDLTNSYTTQNKGINRMNIPGFDPVALPYTWAIFAEEVIANNLMRKLIPPIALNNIFKIQNEAMANFWTKIVPSLGIEIPKDFRGLSLRADDVYFIFSDKKYHNVKADAGGMIALLNYSNPIKLILSLHHEANHQYIPSSTYTEIAVELLAQMIDYQGKSLLPPVNYSNSSYQDGVNELLSLITELNDEYSLTDKDYGTKLFIRSLVASAKDSDADPLQLFIDEYGKIFPNKESIYVRLALYTNDVYYGVATVQTDINSTNTSLPSTARLSVTPKKAVELDRVRQEILTEAHRAGQSIAQAVKFLLPSALPPGVRKYADSIDVPYSQISYALTPQSQANPSGPQFYVVSIFKDASKKEEVYKIGIDENGAGWGGGVQINPSQSTISDAVNAFAFTVAINRDKFDLLNQAIADLAEKLGVESRTIRQYLGLIYKIDPTDIEGLNRALYYNAVGKSGNDSLIKQLTEQLASESNLSNPITPDLAVKKQVKLPTQLSHAVKKLSSKLVSEDSSGSQAETIKNSDGSTYQIDTIGIADGVSGKTNQAGVNDAANSAEGSAQAINNLLNGDPSLHTTSLSKILLKSLIKATNLNIDTVANRLYQYIATDLIIPLEKDYPGTAKRTTLSGLSFVEYDGQLYYGGFAIGDSPVFLLRDNTLYLLTPEGVFEADDPGYLDIPHPPLSEYTAVIDENQPTAATQTVQKDTPHQLGGQATPYVFFGKAKPGDIFFATSDGLIKDIRDSEDLKKLLIKSNDATSLINDALNFAFRNMQTDDWSASILKIPNQKTISKSSTDCSFCSVRIDEALKRGSGNTAKAIRSALTYHNDHTFKPRGLFIQSTLNTALYSLLGDLTGDRTYYEQALAHLDQTQAQLDNVKLELEPGQEKIDPDVSLFAQPIADIISSMPISGTTKAAGVEAFQSNIATARTYLEDKRNSAVPSLLNRFITQPLFSLRLYLNQKYGDRIGRGETESMLAMTEEQIVMQDRETEYLNGKGSKYKDLDIRYRDQSTSNNGYLKDMGDYIGASSIKSPGQGKVTRLGLSRIRRNVQVEIKRLLLNREKFYDQGSYDSITGETSRYLDLLQQALDENDPRLSGANATTLADIQAVIIRNIHTLAFQEYVSTENTLGTHGRRHLIDHNIKVGEQILNIAKKQMSSKYKLTALDYLILHQIMIDHDTGYATGIVRDGVNQDQTKGRDSGHNVLAAKILRERVSSGNDPLSRLFGTEGIARIHSGIMTHDESTVDISINSSMTVESAVHLADNTHAFESKLPSLLYDYPDSIVALRLLKSAGETGDVQLVEEVKRNLSTSILTNTDIGTAQKQALLKAVQSLNKDSYAFTVGRIMGKDPKIEFDEKTNKLVVSVRESKQHQDVISLFDRKAYDQLAKFIADIVGIKKSEAISRINSNEVKFEGDNVVIQAIIGEALKDNQFSEFEQKVEDLIKSDADFVAYILKDNEQKNFLKDLQVKLETTTNQPLSLTDLLATRSFQVLTLSLKTGETTTFTNQDGSLTYTRSSINDTTITESKYISTQDIEYYLRDIEIQTANKDGENLANDSYIINTSIPDPQIILDLESKIANFQKYRAELIRNYLAKQSLKKQLISNIAIPKNRGNSLILTFKTYLAKIGIGIHTLSLDTQISRMATSEAVYLSGQSSLLRRIYSNPRSSYQVYTQKMKEYILPTQHAESNSLDDIKSRAYSEAERLLGGRGKRNHPVKLKIMTNYIDLYITKIREAIDAGEINSPGKNTLTWAEIQTLIIEDVDSLAYQDYIDSANLLSEHGLRQLDYNVKTTFRLLDLAKETGAEITPLNYLQALKIQSIYNLGLTSPLIAAGISSGKYGVEAGFPALSAKLFREQLEYIPDHPLSKLFPNDLEYLHKNIIPLENFTPNINSGPVKDIVSSAIYLSRMTNVFDSNTIPELIFSQPSALKTMRLLKSIGEIHDPTSLAYQVQVVKVKQMLIAEINANPIHNPDDKASMIKAAQLLSPSQWTHNVGRIGGKNPTFTLDGEGVLHIKAEISKTHAKITEFFNQKGYVRFAKLISRLTGKNQDEILNQMNNDIDIFSNENIVIEAVKSPGETTEKTDFQVAVDKILLQDQSLSEYNRRDNLLAIGQKIAEEKLQKYPKSSKADLKNIKKERIKLLEGYLKSLPTDSISSQDSPNIQPAPLLTRFQIQLVRNIIKVMDSLGFFNSLPGPIYQIFSIIQSNYSNIVVWTNSLPALSVQIYQSLTTATITDLQSARMKIAEKNFVYTQTPNAPALYNLYDDSKSTYKAHKKELRAHVKQVKLPKASSIDDLISIANSEIDRLLGGSRSPSNYLKSSQLKAYVAQYLAKMAELNKLTTAEIQPLLIDNIHAIIYQDSVDLENTLSNHGISRIAFNLNATSQILDLAKASGKDIKPIDYLMAMEIVVNQDLALTNKLVRDGINSGQYDLSKGRSALSALLFREKIESIRNNPLAKLYSADQIDQMHNIILENSRPSIDLSNTVPAIIKASIFIANTSNTINPPEIITEYPSSLETMFILKTIGETISPKSPKYRELIQKAKDKLVVQIMSNNDITKSDQSALVLAANQLTPTQWQHIVGRLGGEAPTFTYSQDTNVLTINSNILGTNNQINELFNQNDYPQIIKLIYDFTGIDQAIISDRLAQKVPDFKGDGFTLHINYPTNEAVDSMINISQQLEIFSQLDRSLAKEQELAEANGKSTNVIKQKRVKLIEDFLR